MEKVNDKDFLDELRFDIKTKDKIKARIVLSHIEEVTPEAQKKAIAQLSKADSKFVIPLLVELIADYPAIGDNFQDLKEVLYSKTLNDPNTLSMALIRESKPAYRAVMAEITGEIRLEPATPILLSILDEGQDEELIRSVIIALGMIGDTSATTPISEFLYCGSLDLILAAIQALGQLANKTAIQRLADKLGADTDLDYMILNVFAHCQEPGAIEKLNENLSAQKANIRNAAKKHLTDLGPKSVPYLIGNLIYDDPDLLIHSLNVLGDIGDESAIGPIRKLLHNEPKDANVRFASYEALGKLPVAKGAFALAQGLHDPVDNVRAAAASAINHNYNTVLAAGIKNLIRDENNKHCPISRTIIEAQCDTVFLDLIKEESFSQFAAEYLGQKVHPDIRRYFAELLRNNNLKPLAAKIEKKVEKKVKPDDQKSLKVFAVDDSKMILNIYRSVLHNLGYEPVLFEFPAQAIEKAKTEKPDLIFTDLNMPDINGVDLTRSIRQLYGKEQLPIIMVTTQNECQDNSAAMEAGITAILHKPFNETSLSEAVDKYLSAA
ncbi:MAG: response regulator [Desulfobacteraceae bacterium]|nr:response regulator [Desulfobacteraceae bacterium]